MKRWKLTIEYDGTGFCGWQRQANAISIQQVIEEAILKFSGKNVTLHVAGRTDAGVHARGQTAHFDLLRETDCDEIQGALNYHVKPHRIAILDVKEVPQNFHARFSAISRTYKYTIVNRRAPLAIMADYAWHVPRPLDTEKMRTAAAMLIGKHDFSTFRARDCQAQSPIKTLDVLDIEQNGETIVFTAKARSFLYHQVRNMVGTIELVGAGKWSLEDFKSAFAAADRTKGGPTAPPHGLCLWDVEYPSN